MVSLLRVLGVLVVLGWQSTQALSSTVDGEWSLWTPWSTCSAPCEDIGNTTRNRQCNNPLPAHHGTQCVGFNTDLQTCLGPCDNSSLTSGYLEAKEHLASIHKVFPQLEAHCLREHCHYSEVSSVLSPKRRDRYWSHLICYKYKRACPVDGHWTVWGSWSTCSVECGNGYRYRHRACRSPAPLNGGRLCKGQSTEQTPCVSKECPHISGSERAVFSEWSDFSPCTVSCGSYGYQETKRTCLLKNDCMLENNAVQSLTMSRPCYKGACPVLGGWSEWSEWTECSAIGGYGRKTRLRLCNNPYPSGGASCIGPQVDSSDCFENVTSFHLSLPQDKEETSSEDGDTKDNPLTSKIPASDPYAQPYDTSMESGYESWGSWTACTQTCGGGYRVRTRDCVSSENSDVERTCEGEIQQIQFCNVFVCPESGGWGDWIAWSVCDVTCGAGMRHRYRRCDNPLPASGGSCTGDSEVVQGCSAGKCIHVENNWSEWSKWSSCSKECGGGEKERTREWTGKGTTEPLQNVEKIKGLCNVQECDEPGNWAMWGEWSSCSTTCDLGHHYRDRTCTDPAPSNNGLSCPGPGTEIADCYKGPCQGDEPAVVMSGFSYLTYSAHVKHVRYLLIYLHFKPQSPGGSLFYRYRVCKEGTWECKHIISLNIDYEWRPHLFVNVDGKELKVTSSDVLLESRWNDLLVCISRHSAYIRVNDGDHTTGEFAPPLQESVDFDANMVVGAEKNGSRGFHGIISILRINFKEQALMQSPYWLGPGAPDKQVLITRYNDSDSDMNYPDFWGHHYAELSFQHTFLLNIMMSVLLHGTNGLIVYNDGSITGSYVILSLDEAALKLCFRCGETDVVCETANVLQMKRWYYLTLRVEATQASLRVDKGSAVQVTCLGRRYQPEGTVFLGGAPLQKWSEIKETTGISQAYEGILDLVVVNGEKFNFRRAGLLSSSDVLNSMGFSISAHVSEIVEHITSMVTLRCDFTDFAAGYHQAKAEWLMEDHIMNTTEGFALVPLLPGLRQESSVTLMPAEHQEGLYACVVNQDGRLLITHAFPLFRMAEDLYIRVTTEWTIIISLIVFVFAVFAATITMLVLKRDTIHHFKKTAGDFQDLDDSFGEPNVVNMDYLSSAERDEEEELLTGEEKRSYKQDDVDLPTEDEGEDETQEEDDEPEEDKKKNQGELDLQSVGSEIAKQIIEENKDKILELVASIGSLENFHEVSSRLSQRLSISDVGQRQKQSSSAAQSSSAHSHPSQNNINASAVRTKSNTISQRSSPSRTVRPLNPIHDLDRSSSLSASSQSEVRRSVPKRSLESVSPSRRISSKQTGISTIGMSETNSSPPSPPVEVRRSISRRSSRSPSPSRGGYALHPESPRSLSMSISPPLGSHFQLPLHAQQPSLVKVLPNSIKPSQDQTRYATIENLPSQSDFDARLADRATCPIKGHGQVRHDYSGLALGLSGPPKQPFGPILLSDIKEKSKRLSGEPVLDTEEPDPPYISADTSRSATESSVDPPRPHSLPGHLMGLLPPEEQVSTPLWGPTPRSATATSLESELELLPAPVPLPGMASPSRRPPTPQPAPVTPTKPKTPQGSQVEPPTAPPPPPLM